MAKAGRVHHWKHGWIPLDATARAEVAKRGGGHRQLNSGAGGTSTLERNKLREAWKAKHPDEVPVVQDGVRSNQVGEWRMTTVDGIPEVYFSELAEEVPARPPEQYREVAQHVHDVMSKYPRATAYGKKIQMAWSNELDPSVMADTSTGRGHKIRLNPSMWDDKTHTMNAIQSMNDNHFGLTAEGAKDPETFRRNVITHELGHLINMLDQDEHTNRDPATGEISSEDGATDSVVFERVSPGDFDMLGKQPVPRWRVDSLNKRSAYATTNPYEFYAEAFLDGTVNGDKSSEAGKRAVALAAQVFGPGSPSLRDRMYAKEAAS